ncbi:hypothetical protein Pst134EA_005150 [Puccinia striiformis f. sp. tritici]|uniref:hypothetical protein n=1 Tax=Puccinia striiformis f. sp. tritici TaxID=168172 RepID=UPI002007C27F|nr:hypothetical protein Pst134EA_005150 [Puccinia striiformis f. sp. tritici]KAH9471244.1 hypothetical protein Pst134EA_005150 [Puccinia striiformis f. sp. tritici]
METSTQSLTQTTTYHIHPNRNWYQRKQETEKLRLRLLQNQSRDKVEELKKNNRLLFY